jgi:hypothetical protein
MPATSIGIIAYYLALIGGIIMILLGLLSFIGSFDAFYFHWGVSFGGILTLIMGIIAVIGARSVNTLTWAVVLLIVGLVGGSIGGLLVALGGLIGLIVVLTKTR